MEGFIAIITKQGLELSESELKHIEKIVKRTVKKFAERDLYTIEQAAHRLSIGRGRVKPELINTGRLGVVFIGSKMMIPKNEIENFISANVKIKRSA